MLSFPHFYLADESLRTQVEGISPPMKEKHQFFFDVQPVRPNKKIYLPDVYLQHFFAENGNYLESTRPYPDQFGR